MSFFLSQFWEIAGKCHQLWPYRKLSSIFFYYLPVLSELCKMEHCPVGTESIQASIKWQRSKMWGSLDACKGHYTFLVENWEQYRDSWISTPPCDVGLIDSTDIIQVHLLCGLLRRQVCLSPRAECWHFKPPVSIFEQRLPHWVVIHPLICWTWNCAIPDLFF